MRVEPIRDKEDIAHMEWVLMRKSWRDWMGFKLGINCALRIGDIVKLRVWHVRARYLSLNEQKTGKQRRHYLNDSMRALLEEYTHYMADDDFLLRSHTRNKAPDVSTMYRSITGAAKIIGLENIGTHSCRKTFGYHHYQEFKDIALLMIILNHSTERETLKYIGILQDELDINSKQYFL